MSKMEQMEISFAANQLLTEVAEVICGQREAHSALLPALLALEDRYKRDGFKAAQAFIAQFRRKVDVWVEYSAYHAGA